MSDDADALIADVYALVRKLRDRKMSETAFRRKVKTLLEAQTESTPAEIRNSINELVKKAKADRKLFDSLKSFSGS